MTKTFASRATPIALAAFVTATMFLATNVLAGHAYRVTMAAQGTTLIAAADLQDAAIPGPCVARA